MTITTSPTIVKPFTQSWIQALTLAADNPLARTIKPKLDWIDHLSLIRTDSDRRVAAQGLWDFAQSEGLLDLLWYLPCKASQWVFDRDDIFQYSRAVEDSAASDEANFERWKQAIGVEPGEFPLTAEVAGSDWAGLVRKEAVRLQHSLNTTAVQQSANLSLPCIASWDCKSWQVQFSQLDWIVVNYDDTPIVPRPAFAETVEKLMWLLATASDELVSKRSAQCALSLAPQPWQACALPLAALHESFRKQSTAFSPWIAKTWNCVWPVVYREQNVLNGLADLEQIRLDIKSCLTAQPRLTIWMFVFAKLVCQAQLGRGLGLIADFHD